MKLTRALSLLTCTLLSWCSAADISKVWVADNRDGTYKNPILHADYSDPDVVRVGEDFYLVASSFNAVPGLPILHSKDLVNCDGTNFMSAGEPFTARPGRWIGAKLGLFAIRSGAAAENGYADFDWFRVE